MTDTSNRNRQSAGQPVGGQFATEAKGTATGVDLGGGRPGPAPVPGELWREVAERAGRSEISDDCARGLLATLPIEEDPDGEHVVDDLPLQFTRDGMWSHDKVVNNWFGEGDEFRDALHRHYRDVARTDPRQMDAYSALGTWSMNKNPLGTEESPPVNGIEIDRGTHDGLAWVAMDDPNRDYDEHVYGGRMYVRLPADHPWHAVDANALDETYDEDGNVEAEGLRKGMPHYITFNDEGWVGVADPIVEADPETRMVNDVEYLAEVINAAR